MSFLKTVRIKDVDGQSCRLSLNNILPFMVLEALEQEIHGKSISTFNVLDIGFIKYQSGGFTYSKNFFTLKTNLGLTVGNGVGIRLDDFYGSIGLIQDSGTGRIEQSWASKLKSGTINWIVE